MSDEVKDPAPYVSSPTDSRARDQLSCNRYNLSQERAHLKGRMMPIYRLIIATALGEEATTLAVFSTDKIAFQTAGGFVSRKFPSAAIARGPDEGDRLLGVWIWDGVRAHWKAGH